MGLEFAANIGILIAVVGFMLFFLRRMDRIKDELKADIVRVKDELKADMVRMETDLKAEINLKHGEVRQDLQDVRSGLVQVRERQACLEGILEGRGVIPTPEPAATAE